MKFLPAFGASILMGCCILVMNGCMDKGGEAPPDPVTASRTSVSVVQGTSTTVQISGGDPPYFVSVSPDPRVASAAFVDSTMSPSSLVISAPVSATDGANTSITVGDADEANEGGANQRTTHDDNSVTIFVTIDPVGTISYADDIQPIWDGTCQNRGCHPGGGAPFSFDRFVSWNNLYYATVSNMSCGAVYRVAAGNPDSSLVYLMVSGKTSCPRMPLSLVPGDTMSAVDQGKIFDWILQGALNN